MHQQLVGHVFKNRYLVLAHIGTGGFAATYKCRDLIDEKFKVLKVEINSNNKSAQIKLRLNSQGELLQKLSHPNIVKCSDIFFDQSMKKVIVMDWIAGEGLNKYIGFLNKHHMIKIYLQLKSALQYLASQNIIHRDISPDNIIIDENMDAHLIDFGIANQDVKKKDPHTKGGYGKNFYLAIQILYDQSPCCESDLWAFGIVLLEMVTGQDIEDLNAKSQRSSIYSDQNFPKEELKLLKDTHNEFSPILLSLLKKKAQERKLLPINYKNITWTNESPQIREKIYKIFHPEVPKSVLDSKSRKMRGRFAFYFIYFLIILVFHSFKLLNEQLTEFFAGMHINNSTDI